MGVVGILFVLIFILLMNFVVSNIVRFFGQELDRMMFLLIAAAIVVLCLGYLIFHQNAKSIIGDYWETTTMTVLGILTVALSVIAVFWLVEGGLLAWTPYSIRGVYWGWSFVIAVVGLSIYAWWVAHSTVIRTIQIPVDNLQTPSRIIYMSDIHIAKKSDLPFLYSIIEKVNKIDADFVVINWDFIDGRGFDVGDFDVLNTINKEVIFTYGNHEAYAGNEYVRSLLSPTKLHMLSDQKLILSWREILGLSDMNGSDSQKNRNLLAHKLKNIQWETEYPKLLVLHEPVGPEVAMKYGVNLQVAGHTHNGQIFPFTLFVKMAFPYIKGLYSFDTSSLFVSSGIGTWGPAMRLGSRSELIVLDLIPKK